MYTWRSAEQLEETYYRGKNVNYPGSGFAIDLPLNLTNTMAVWDSLSQNLFIDRHTRILFVDFNTVRWPRSLLR